MRSWGDRKAGDVKVRIKLRVNILILFVNMFNANFSVNTILTLTAHGKCETQEKSNNLINDDYFVESCGCE